MARAVYRRRHSWRGFHAERALWLRVTVAFWTWDFFPGAIAARMEKIIDTLFDDPGSAGSP